MKIELEISKLEGAAFMSVYSVGLAVMAGKYDKAVERAAVLRQGQVSLLAGSMMRKLCEAIDPAAAAKASEAEQARFGRDN